MHHKMHHRWTEKSRQTFIEALTSTGNVSHAASVVGCNKTTVYNHRKSDPEFAAEWEEALEAGTEALEQEARRRAMGWEEERWTKDGSHTVHKHSDLLLIFLLKARRPEVYRDNPPVHVHQTPQIPDIPRAAISAELRSREGKKVN